MIHGMKIDTLDLIKACHQLEIRFSNILDGGGGMGIMSAKYSPFTAGKVYCFEPFPGNWQFIEGRLEEFNNIKLIKKALYSHKATKNFYVRSVAPDNFTWDVAHRNIGGYSSLGHLADAFPASSTDDQKYIVEAIDADSEIPADEEISFVKLDLQGGELDALQGMKRILGQAHFLHIEYTGQPGLLEFLEEKDFKIFEQDYLLLSEPQGSFEKFREITLSTGVPAYFAHHTGNYGSTPYEQFLDYKKKYKMVCTDLLCVPASGMDIFERACAHYSEQSGKS